MVENNRINWHDVSDNFRELRRNIGQATIAARKSSYLNQPPQKRRREGSELDVTIDEDKFPPINTQIDSLSDPARFLVSSANAKIFIGAMFTLMKLSDSVLLYPTRDGLTVKACNMAKTAAGTFNFCIEFFSAIHTYEFPKEKPCCRVFMKPFLIVLRKTEMLKELENFIIDMDPVSETMVFRVNLRNGVNKLYKLPLTDVLVSSLPRLIQRDDSLNVVVLSARNLTDALNLAGKNTHELGLWASESDIIFHTLFQASAAITQWRNGALRITDHINVSVRKLVNLGFIVRDVRALSKFADKYNIPVSLYFKTAKAPLFAVIDIPGHCNSTFTISTSSINGLNIGKIIEKMLPETTIDIPLATQLDLTASNMSTSTRTENTFSQFQPIDIDQTHELVRICINTQPSSYWRKAIAVRELEVVELE